MLDSGSLEDFGNKGILGSVIDPLTISILNLCLVSEKNHVMMLR
jgi:hypothetical protein